MSPQACAVSYTDIASQQVCCSGFAKHRKSGNRSLRSASWTIKQRLATATAELLEIEGYRAISAFSAREAVDPLDDLLDEMTIDLVLSDIRMPDVDGFDLLRVLRHRFPALPIVLMSGLPITSDDVVPHGASILQKPFTIEESQRAVQRNLRKAMGFR